MNVENFSYYLLDTSKLRELGYQDLQNLIDKYPYCQNLHYLICKKSHIEDHPDFEKWLQLAATYSTDRAYLYQLLLEVDFEKDYTFETIDLDELVQHKEKENSALPTIEPEVVLHETREDAIVSQTLAALQAQQANQPQDSRVHLEDDEPLVTFSSLLNDTSEIIEEEAIEIENEEEFPSSVGINLDEEEDEAFAEEEKDSLVESSPLLIDEKPIVEELIITPLPKTAFNSYKNKVETTAISDLPFANPEEMAEYRRRLEEKMSLEHEKRKKREEKKKKESELVAFAEESLKEKEDNVSETLAKILALQGHKDKAIIMYEKLKLQIPEKSAFFAAQIESLKIS